MTETRSYVPPADIAVERVRPAVKDDSEGTDPAKGILIGIAIGIAFWVSVFGVAAVVA